MTFTQHLRNRFTDESLATASPARVVVMAYQRLDRDLTGALDALGSRDLERTNELLCHAQDLVAELDGMLDHEVWEHAASLSSIYRFVGELLTTANIAKRSEPVEQARTLLADLGSAFTEAASVAAASPTPTPGADPTGGTSRVWTQA